MTDLIGSDAIPLCKSRSFAIPFRLPGRKHSRTGQRTTAFQYGAQAMAVHGGLLAREGATPRAGFLVALRGVQIQRVRIDDLPGELHGLAELLMQSDTSQQYAFRIEHAGALIAEGRAAVMLQD